MSTVLLKIYVRDRAICKWGRVSQACPTRCLPGDTGVLTAVALQESGVFEKTRCVSGVGTDETAVSLKGVGSPGLLSPQHCVSATGLGDAQGDSQDWAACRVNERFTLSYSGLRIRTTSCHKTSCLQDRRD